MIISPELEDRELNHEGNFYICQNCPQIITKEFYEKFYICPNCELKNFYAIKDKSAIWWLANCSGYLKTIEYIGIDLMKNEKLKKIMEQILKKTNKGN